MFDWKLTLEAIGMIIYATFMGFIFMGIERKATVSYTHLTLPTKA